MSRGRRCCCRCCRCSWRRLPDERAPAGRLARGRLASTSAASIWGWRRRIGSDVKCRRHLAAQPDGWILSAASTRPPSSLGPTLAPRPLFSTLLAEIRPLRSHISTSHFHKSYLRACCERQVTGHRRRWPVETVSEPRDVPWRGVNSTGGRPSLARSALGS